MKFALLGLLALLCVEPLAAYPLPWRNQDERSWVGKTVVMKRYGVSIYRTNDDRIDVVVGTLNRTDYVVVQEKEGRIWVRQDGAEGWFSKEDATLADEGVEFFSKQLQQTPNDASLYAKRSKCHELKGDTDAAIKDYDEAIRIAPNSSSWWNNRANLYQKRKDHDRALEDYNHALELSPASFIALGNRGNAYNHKREYERAVRDYNAAIQQNSKFVNAHANRGNAYRELREFEKALKNYEEALKIDPQFSYAFANRAALWLAQRRYDRAEEDLAAAIRSDPRSSLAFLIRGNLRKAMKEYRRAIDDYDHSIWLESKSSEARAERGNVRRELKEYESALKDYDEALKIEPKSVTASIGKAWLLATCPDSGFRAGGPACELARQACESTKNRMPEALEALAAAYAETDQFEEAIRTQRKATAIDWYNQEKGDEIKRRLQRYENKKAYRDEYKK